MNFHSAYQKYLRNLELRVISEVLEGLVKFVSGEFSSQGDDMEEFQELKCCAGLWLMDSRREPFHVEELLPI